MLHPGLLLTLAAGLGGFVKPAPASLTLATTTSTRDSGLLAALVPAFAADAGIEVETIAVGSGEALALGRSGGADVLLVHSPAAEEAFMSEGHGLLRLAVMHNDFVLAGPAADPAGARGLPVLAALAKVAAAGAPFVSRGDRSGTHAKELELWAKAGLRPGGDGYRVTGLGQGETARVAAGRQAYTLVDRGTCLALGADLGLSVLCEGGPDLRNPYHVLVVDPARHPRVRVREARRFAEWLVSPATRERIAGFGRERHGRSLFVPDAGAADAAGGGTT
jgi:tungstate transport system substrate-binding protein